MLKLLMNRVIYGRHLKFQGQECVYGKNKCQKWNPRARISQN